MQPEYVYNAFVTNVVDGDTVDAIVDLGFTVSVKVRFRLYGVDTPELTSSDVTIRENAQKAKTFIVDKLLNKNVTLKSYKTDKYGRWLANFYTVDNTVSVNDQLIEQKLAVPYFGGTKI